MQNAGCATNEASSAPVLGPSSYPVDRSDFVPVAYGGRIGVWVSEDGLGNMLAGFEADKGALRVEIARSKVLEQLARERSEAVEKSAKAMQWRANYGPWIGFFGGVLLSFGVVMAGVFAGKAIAPQLAPGGR